MVQAPYTPSQIEEVERKSTPFEWVVWTKSGQFPAYEEIAQRPNTNDMDVSLEGLSQEERKLIIDFALENADPELNEPERKVLTALLELREARGLSMPRAVSGVTGFPPERVEQLAMSAIRKAWEPARKLLYSRIIE